VARETYAVQNPTVLIADHAIKHDLRAARNVEKISPEKNIYINSFTSCQITTKCIKCRKSFCVRMTCVKDADNNLINRHYMQPPDNIL